MADTSSYRILQPIDMPVYSEFQRNASTLKKLGMENQELQRKADKQKRLDAGLTIEKLAGLPEEARAQEYAKERARMIENGFAKPEDMPEQYDPGIFRQDFAGWRGSPEYKEWSNAQLKGQLENEKTQAEIDHLKAKAKRGVDPATGEVLPAGAAPAKLAKAGGEVKQKIGHLTSGLQALTRYEDTFRGGGRQSYVDPSTPLIGNFVSSTPIDEARTSMEEAIGRLASGGAINSDEEGRFRRMLPLAADDDATAARKLLDLRKDMEGKLTAYGFQVNELPSLGYNPQDLGYGTEHASMDMRGLLPAKKEEGGIIQKAHADGKEQGPKKPAAKAGAIVMVDGKHYRVGADGDTLEEIKGKK